MTDRPRRGNIGGMVTSEVMRRFEQREGYDASEDTEADGGLVKYDWRLPNAPAPPHPREDVTGDPVRERRAFVELLWSHLYSSSEIEAIAGTRFNVSEMTIKKDLREIKKAYIAEERDPLVTQTRKARMRRMLESLIQDSRAAGDRKAAGYLATQLAKIDGLFAPIKHEITQGNPNGLTLEAIIEAIGDDENALKAFELIVSKLEAKGVKPIGVDEAAQLEAGAIDVKAEDA